MVPYFLNANLYPAARNADSAAFFSAIAGNTGNSAITHAMLKLTGRDATYLTRHTSHPSLLAAPVSAGECERINTEFSHVFLTLQDQLRLDFDDRFYLHACETLERLHLPVIAYSLGANNLKGEDISLARHISPVQRRFLALLSQKCRVIGIRGHYTAAILDLLGIHNYHVIGCPSYFERGPERRLVPRPWDESLGVGATGLYSHPDKERLRYFLQDEVLAAKIVHFPDAITEDDYRHFSSGILHIRPYLESLANAIERGAAKLYADMDLWRADIARVNFVIGTRLHGAIKAINAGRLAIVTNRDARATEICRFLGIPHYPGGIGLPHDLRAIYESIDVESINNLYAARYENFIGWMRSNGLPQPLSLAQTSPVSHLPMNPPDIQAQKLAQVRHHISRHASVKSLWMRFRPHTGLVVKLRSLAR